MNILILILSIIDTTIIYLIDIKLNDIIPEIIIDIFGTVFMYLIMRKLQEKYENSIKIFRYLLLVSLLIVFVGLIIAVIKQQLIIVQSSFSMIIPSSLSYFILLWKQKRDDSHK